MGFAKEGGVTEDRLLAIGNLLNRGTGRGDLGTSWLGNTLRHIGWAPGYRLSGPQMLMQLAHKDAFVRRQAAEQLVTWATGGMAILGLAYVAGKEVGITPNSSEFGKIKIGNSSYNIWGTDQVLARTIFQIIEGERVGRPTILPDGTVVPNKSDVDASDALWNYARSGADPLIGTAIDIQEGKNILGEERGLEGEGLRSVLLDQFPLIKQDIQDIYEADGPLQAALSAPFVGGGLGVTTYEQDSSDVVYAMPRYEGVPKEQEGELFNFMDEVRVMYEQVNAVEKVATQAQVAESLARLSGREELGALAADYIAGGLTPNMERLAYIVNNQDSMPDTVLDDLPREVAGKRLTPENLERYAQSRAAN
jgi:hypothetical protein